MSFPDISKSSTSVENKGVTISHVSNKKKWVKSDKSGAKNKDVSTGDNAKFGDKGQKQNSDKQKQTKQNSKSSDQNNAKKKWCAHHKQNNTHVTKDCFVLQKSKKRINKVDEANSDSDDGNGNKGNNEGNKGYEGIYKYL